ncbi:MAG: putative bifunctional diguanylate cyclase/phosphodiesterase, partial [Phycisphaeraceae bacterium]
LVLDVLASRRLDVAPGPERASRARSLDALPDLGRFRRRLKQSLARSRRDASARFAVLLLDLDRFNVINQTVGHEAGDELLTAVADRLEACLACSGTGGDSGSHLLARMGADTFLILVEGVAGEEDALRLAERIDDALRGDFTCGGRKVRVATTTGIALADAGYDRAEQVLRDAELALRRAKAHGRGSALLFAPDMREETTSRLDIEHELDQAVSREQLRLDYQPIVNLGSGEVVGFEALLRWDHPRLGRVSPGRFIPVAEETGLIVPLGRWVLEEACAQLGRWLRMGMKQLPGMSINLSRRQLTRPGLVEQVAHCLEANDLPPGLVHLEITESALMEDAPAGAAALEGLRQLGVRLSMDDFGTGYSSLACLHRFPLDVLKIDRSFVSNMGLRRDYTAVVQAIVSLAHNLGMAVIAEGIETPDQVLQLQALDADLGQGYHFGRPMNAGAAEQLLRLGRVHRQSA